MQFLAHFEKRKVATGTCARAFGTPCIHEHACVRCSLLRPDPAQRARLEEIRDNLHDRITEAEREGWPGEVEGLKVSLAGAETNSPRSTRPSGGKPPPSISAYPHSPASSRQQRHPGSLTGKPRKKVQTPQFRERRRPGRSTAAGSSPRTSPPTWPPGPASSATAMTLT